MFRFYGCLEGRITPSKRKHIKQVFETTIQIGKWLPKRLSNRLTPNAQPLDVILVATKIHIIGAKAGRACKKNTRNPMDMGLPLEITNGVKGIGFGLYLSLLSAIWQCFILNSASSSQMSLGRPRTWRARGCPKQYLSTRTIGMHWVFTPSEMYNVQPWGPFGVSKLFTLGGIHYFPRSSLNNLPTCPYKMWPFLTPK